ncbi:MAG: DUF350 domain-containing protein [Anaerolineae bacterium]
MELIILSVAQLVLVVLLGAVAAFLGTFIFERATRGLDEWAEVRRGNSAVGLVLGAIVVGIALVLRPAVSISLPQQDLGRFYPYYALLAEALQVFLGLILAVASISVALCIFSKLTKDLDELEELKKGNMAVAIMLGGVIIAVSFLITGAVEQIVSRIVAAIF